MILTWHEDAEEEYVSAAVYYERQVDGLGERFLEQIEATLARVIYQPGCEAQDPVIPGIREGQRPIEGRSRVSD